MNKEYKNIWKFIKSENPALGSMAISMAKGLNNEDNTNYKNSDNIVSMIELKQKMYDFHNNIPIDDTLNPRIQMHQWYWYYVIALIQDRQANADHNLTIWESYRKEVK
jgi:hypothetical protein